MCCGPYNALERKRARSRAAASGAVAYLWNAAPYRGSAELPRARLAASRTQPSPSNYQASSLQPFAVSTTVFTSKFSHTASLQFCFHFDKYMQQTTVGRREPNPFIFLAPRQDCQGKQTLHSQSTWFFGNCEGLERACLHPFRFSQHPKAVLPFAAHPTRKHGQLCVLCLWLFVDFIAPLLTPNTIPLATSTPSTRCFNCTFAYN